MSDADSDQKTEDPSGKRLDEAREHGQIPVSRELSTWVVMLAILIVMAWMLPGLMERTAQYLRMFLEHPHTFAIDEQNAQSLLFETLVHIGLIAGLVFALLMAAGVAGVMLQTGFFFALDLATPDIARLSPSRGLQKLFSLNAVAELVKSLGKMGFLGGISFVVLTPIALESPHLTGLPLEGVMAYLHQKAIHLIIMLVLAFAIIAIADFFYTRYQYIKNLRMTKTEVKDEYKQQEGDPAIKGRLRQLRADKARKRMMAQVPKADVVITNPTHYAIALQYDGNRMSAPVVLAKGINLIADRIREIAEENRIPLVSNPPLARALHSSVEIDQAIPTQHYRAVAEVISYVYKLKKKRF